MGMVLLPLPIVHQMSTCDYDLADCPDLANYPTQYIKPLTIEGSPDIQVIVQSANYSLPMIVWINVTL